MAAVAMSGRFKVEWVDSGREPQCAPSPFFPNGVDISSHLHGIPGVRFCKVRLPYPAKRCGVYLIECTKCGHRTGVTTAGRRDDPRSIELDCQG